jgi:hypothetical protein
MANPPVFVSSYQLAPASRIAPIQPGGVLIAPPTAPRGTVFLDPSLFPPAGSQAFNVAANQAIVGAGAFFRPAALTFDIPQNCYGVINSIDLLLDSIAINTQVLWTLLINGSPVPGFNPITILGRNGAASVSKSWPGPLRILIPLGGVVQWLIQDVDGGLYTAGTAVYGWFWPQVRDDEGHDAGPADTTREY